jgi:hypothetical protein
MGAYRRVRVGFSRFHKCPTTLTLSCAYSSCVCHSECPGDKTGQDAVRCAREHLYAAYKRTRVDHHMYAFRPSLLFFIEVSYYSSQHTSKKISSVVAPSSQLTPIRTRSSLGVHGRTFLTMSILGTMVKRKLALSRDNEQPDDEDYLVMTRYTLSFSYLTITLS